MLIANVGTKNTASFFGCFLQWCSPLLRLCSISGKWMNENRALVEWYWQGKTIVLGGKKSVPVSHCPPHI
jgi:hypothetical protein